MIPALLTALRKKINLNQTTLMKHTLRLLIILSLTIFISAQISANVDPASTPSNVPGQVRTKTDTIKSSGIKQTDTIIQTNPNTDPPNTLPIDTGVTGTQQQAPTQVIPVPVDTATKIDSSLIEPVSENVLTNTRLFIYIILSVLGLALFFYIFVITLFKTFHKVRSTRQSLLLSWNLFFIVSIIWIFIIWGLVAGFWTAASFMIVVIFLFIISLIMTIIAVKSK